MSTIVPSVGAINLQEQLHQLLTRLSSTIDIIKSWPESDGDDASNHVETTTKLITAILDVIEGLKDVEGVVKADSSLRKSLNDCQIPMNLLDLLDHGVSGLNPGKSFGPWHRILLPFTLSTSDFSKICFFKRLFCVWLVTRSIGTTKRLETTKISSQDVGRGSPVWLEQERLCRPE